MNILLCIVILIYDEMKARNYKCNYNKFSKWIDIDTGMPFVSNLFKDWHDERYLKQCLFNLEEKFMCGGIPNNEWKLIAKTFWKELDYNEFPL